jgi:hypothetical protein
MTAPIAKPEPVDVPFMCAGAPFVGRDNAVSGTFHPISRELWNCIIGFHRQASINFDGESVSYHRWHAPSKEYHSLIPWQNTSQHGLHVDANWQDARNKALLDEYARRYGCDFFPACTIHTHVDASGFESGTDAKDEYDNPGWHITLGHLVSYPKYNFHFRMRMPRKKALNEQVNTESAITLKWEHLFSPSPEMEEFIHTTPGTCDWHEFLERITAK